MELLLTYSILHEPTFSSCFLDIAACGHQVFIVDSINRQIGLLEYWYATISC